MSIETRCPSCECLLRAPDSAAGRAARCPSCGETVELPAAAVPVISDAEITDDLTTEAPPPASTLDELDRAGARPCPVCGEQIKTVAIRCRFCGEEVHSGGNRPNRQRTSDPITSLVMGVSAILFGCVPAYCIPIAIGALVVASNERRQAIDSHQPTHTNTSAGFVCCVIVLCVWGLILGMLLLGADIDIPNIFG